MALPPEFWEEQPTWWQLLDYANEVERPADTITYTYTREEVIYSKADIDATTRLMESIGSSRGRR